MDGGDRRYFRASDRIHTRSTALYSIWVTDAHPRARLTGANRRARLVVVALVAALAPAFGAAPALGPAIAPAACPEHFRDGRTPILVNPKLAELARPLCFAGFAVLHSGRSRTPLYAAEHLTRARLGQARDVERTSEFHEEPRLAPPERAELADYVRSGFDRGHMAPSGDMPDLVSQLDSFSLANVVPQDPTDNRNLWADIESAVRRIARDEGEIYVVTGPLYEGSEVRALRGRVLVPTHLFKAVYLPRRGLAGAYLARNDSDRDWRLVPVAEIARRAGIEVFPGLPEAARTNAAPLPEPRDSGWSRDRTAGRRERPREDPFESWLAGELRRALRTLWRAFLRAMF